MVTIDLMQVNDCRAVFKGSGFRDQPTEMLTCKISTLFQRTFAVAVVNISTLAEVLHFLFTYSVL